MTVKKKRTPAQIAATKKLVAFNKKRRGTAKKKRVVKKKATRARNPIANKQMPVFYVAYVPVGEKKYYYHGYNSAKKMPIFDDDINGALWYRTPGRAITEVTFIGKKSGALSRKHTIAAERFKPGK